MTSFTAYPLAEFMMQSTGPSGLVILDDSFRVVFATASILACFTGDSTVSAMDAVAARIRENMFALFDSGAAGDNRDTCSRIFPELAGSYTCRGISLEPRLPGSGALALLFEPRGLPQSELAAAVAAYSLTRREFEILHYLVLGLTNKEIAQRMEISPNTVKAFVHSISSKMNVTTRSGIVGILLGDNRGPGTQSTPHAGRTVRRGAESAGSSLLRAVRRPA